MSLSAVLGGTADDSGRIAHHNRARGNESGNELPFDPSPIMRVLGFMLPYRLDGRGRSAELVGIAQPIARGSDAHSLRREAVVGRVPPHLVVVLPPALDDASGLGEAG